MAPRPIHTLPIGYRWPHRPGITLLGDAAHLMSPFSGEGANLAMRDAADLASALATAADWNTAVENFELTMFTRAEPAAAEASRAINETFSDQGLRRMLQHMDGFHG